MPQEPAPTPDPGSSSDDGVLALAPGVTVRRADLDEQFVRSSGPGGQNVNKVASAVVLRVPLDAIRGLDGRRMSRLRKIAKNRINAEGVLILQVDTHRTQLQNRRAAEERLRELVTRAWQLPKTRKKTKPSRGAVERRLKAKRVQKDKKQRRRGNFD